MKQSHKTIVYNQVVVKYLEPATHTSKHTQVNSLITINNIMNQMAVLKVKIQSLKVFRIRMCIQCCATDIPEPDPVYIRMDKDRLARCLPPYLIRDVLVLVLVSVVTLLSTNNTPGISMTYKIKNIYLLNKDKIKIIDYLFNINCGVK